MKRPWNHPREMLAHYRSLLKTQPYPHTRISARITARTCAVFLWYEHDLTTGYRRLPANTPEWVRRIAQSFGWMIH